MSYRPQLPLHTDLSPEDVAQALAEHNATYTLLYWNLNGVASTAREILVYGKADYKFESPIKKQWWANETPSPFACLPVLTITTPSKKEVIMSETMVIDQFLAKKFGLLGDTEWESLTILSFYSNIHFLQERAFENVNIADDDRKLDARSYFLNCTLPTFIHNHEFHLRKNGENGHYVGNKLSLADIQLSNVIHYLQTLPFAKLALPLIRASAPIWKVHESVRQQPEIATWRASEAYQRIEEGSFEWYAHTAVPGENLEAWKEE
ncbi:Glutathione S-transferase S1 [Podila epicladia]|nr:Glutathione S-transferase S1 [Podila epicladia]KAG0081121.1 Glutathione S-transferase S1 [Podila epicladia]